MVSFRYFCQAWVARPSSVRPAFVNWPVEELKSLPCPAEVQRACSSEAQACASFGLSWVALIAFFSCWLTTDFCPRWTRRR